jgi:hypothetical protein
LSDSAVVIREKLMHGLPVRVVAVTNVDLKIMSRRTPTHSVVAVTGFFDRLLTRLMTGGTSWAAEQ